MCYLPDENEAKKRGEEGHRKVEAALAALFEVRAAPALELLARLKKIESEIEAILGCYAPRSRAVSDAFR